jgi:hypothetical protein
VHWFAIVKPPDEHIGRLGELSSIDVTQFNIYIMNGEEEAPL